MFVIVVNTLKKEFLFWYKSIPTKTQYQTQNKSKLTRSRSWDSHWQKWASPGLRSNQTGLRRRGWWEAGRKTLLHQERRARKARLSNWRNPHSERAPWLAWEVSQRRQKGRQGIYSRAPCCSYTTCGYMWYQYIPEILWTPVIMA